MSRFCYSDVLLLVVILHSIPHLSDAAVRNIAQGKNTTQPASYTYKNGTADLAVDGVYDKYNLDTCTTIMYPYQSTTNVYWYLELEDYFAIFSVVIHNTAVLPESTLTSSIRVCVLNVTRSTYSICEYTSSLQPGGKVTVHFNEIVLGNRIRIQRQNFLTLCEVEVLGTELVTDVEQVIPLNATSAWQNHTLGTRLASYAVDGNNNTVNVEMCATSFVYPDDEYQRAWIRVDLGDIYLVTKITVHLPTTERDKLYAYYLESWVTHNDTMSTDRSGRCQRSVSYSSAINGVLQMPCLYTGFYPIGKYVFVGQLYTSTGFSTILTICELSVTGVRQVISVYDPAFSVFRPQVSELPVDNQWTLAMKLSVTAIVVAGTFALFFLAFFIFIVVKFSQDGHDGGPRRRGSNKYTAEMEPHQRRRTTHDEDMYTDVVSGGNVEPIDDLTYEVVPDQPAKNRRLPAIPANGRKR